MKLILTVVTLLAMTAAAFAQEAVPVDTTVTVPWGNWVNGVVDVALPALGTVLTGVVTYIVSAYVPPWLRAITGQRGQQRVNEIINNAVMSAVGQTKNAMLGKALEIPVANEVLRRAMQYAVDQAPKLIKDAANSNAENLAKMVMARMTQWGLLPPKWDLAKAKAEGTTNSVVNNSTGKPVVTNPPPKGDFSFDSAIKKGFGG
jgi:hypothetical protein